LNRFKATFALLTLLVSAAAHAEIIDRILAVVNGTLIMQSDVTMAVRLGPHRSMR
jgi:hypothetical protein